MREAIERVIAELDEMVTHHDKRYRDRYEKNREYHEGAGDGIDKAIAKLREVLANEQKNT